MSDEGCIITYLSNGASPERRQRSKDMTVVSNILISVADATFSAHW